ncbi:MAG: glucose 1-dehydrogenase [Euryhalocaulis sp.]|uniref:glucose 1-dehydrogenase n=1 Tax=Euryhalocaulis sp. TaxID=2744307 RepID=UPI00184BAB18|nr:glucose 1-dehydrogenase [Euryhalocaulis sp.]MBA4800801.1 glucose 1-dehydrogenase [Euryhalocaulis sp.]
MSLQQKQIHEDGLPGSEADLEPKPEWRPRFKSSGRLQGKVAVITGGDSGIGRATAALFAREGADVAIVYLKESEDAKKTVSIIESEGRKALALEGDLGDAEFCKKVIKKVIDKFGQLDVLVNNAGEQHPDKNITDITEDQLRRTFQTNIFAMFFLVQAAVAHLHKGGVIVNCTSVTMYKGAPPLLDYSSTKGAITAFTRSLAINLADQGIRVNAVAPGPVWTPLNPSGGATKEMLENFGEDTLLGRPGQPNEIAPAFLFLACEDSSYMTGQVLHPNGGYIVGG